MEFLYRRNSFLPLYPSDLFLAFWSLLLIFMLILTAIFTPIRLSFIDDDDKNWNIADTVFDIFFTFDIIINFISAYYDQSN